MRIDTRNATWFDHVLAMIGAMLAAYSAGIGIGDVNVGYFFMGAILACALVSFGLTKLVQGTAIARWDGIFYLVACMAAILARRPLNELLPGDGYPAQLAAAGVLSWMLAFGTVATWRDQTLLFQIVPSIALFGLVGAWNTFEGVPVLFFVFILCAATLFARVHVRSSLEQVESVERVASGKRALGEQELVESLRSGPWRWMAGPEWALVSAMFVVGFSVVGAPLLQRSVQAVAGVVQISVPQPRQPSDPANAPATFGNPQSLGIGNGPRLARSNPVLRVKLDQKRYLKGGFYYAYGPRGWEDLGGEGPPPSIDGAVPMREVAYEYDVLSGRHPRIYVPGEPSPRMNGFERAVDGAVFPRGSVPNSVAWAAQVPVESAKPGRAAVPPTLVARLAFASANSQEVTPRVQELAQSAVEGIESDYDRATAIKQAIESRVKYNLNAPAIPEGKDPVDTFLFETREGYCDLFATAMAQMARAVGMPSRVATGFWPNGEPNSDGYYVIRESDYHMWAEIYFEGVGWMPFDPTEGAESVPGSERGAAREDPKPWYEQRWVQDALEVAVFAIIGGIILLSIRGLFVRRQPVAKRVRSQAGRLYARFQRDLERRTGKPRRLSQTPREYLERVRPELPAEAAQVAEEVTSRFESALWSKDDPGEEELKELAGSVREFHSASRGRP